MAKGQIPKKDAEGNPPQKPPQEQKAERELSELYSLLQYLKVINTSIVDITTVEKGSISNNSSYITPAGIADKYLIARAYRPSRNAVIRILASVIVPNSQNISISAIFKV